VKAIRSSASASRGSRRFKCARVVGEAAFYVAAEVAQPTALDEHPAQALVRGGIQTESATRVKRGVVMGNRRLRCVYPGGRVRGPGLVLEALGVVTSLREVMGELFRVVVQLVRLQRLERLGRAEMQPCTSRCRELLVDRLADERVRKRVTPDRLGRLDEHALGDR
jgi:hypothetical protein